jgi:hypothetical protein
MARRTRSAVSGVTLSEPLIVRETVAVETLASLATSLMFMSYPRVQKKKARYFAHSSNLRFSNYRVPVKRKP